MESQQPIEPGTLLMLVLAVSMLAIAGASPQAQLALIALLAFGRKP